MTQARCSGRNKDGGACSAPALPGDSLCAWHSPRMRERVAAGRAKGGRGRSSASRTKKSLPAGVLTNDELRGLVGMTIKRVLTGTTEPAIGNSVAALARAYVAVTESGAVERLEERLAELERLAARGSA